MIQKFPEYLSYIHVKKKLFPFCKHRIHLMVSFNEETCSILTSCLSIPVHLSVEYTLIYIIKLQKLEINYKNICKDSLMNTFVILFIYFPYYSVS